jgi:hypothetical protein
MASAIGTITTETSHEVLIAVDISGSTGEEGAKNYYWNTVDEIYQDLKKTYGENIRVILWDDKWDAVTTKTLESCIAKKNGRNGTNPVFIVEGARHLKHKGDICIITDGQVHDISQVESSMAGSYGKEKWSFARVFCHIIRTLRDANMSVTCPFTRDCESEIYTYDMSTATTTKIVSLTAEDLAVLTTLDTVDTMEDFMSKYATLENVLIAKNMGKDGMPEIRDKLLAMQSRIVKSMATIAGAEIANDLRTALLSKDIDMAVAISRKMVEDYYGDVDPMSFAGKVSYLVNLCGDLRGQYSHALIKSSRAVRAGAATAKPITSVPEIEVSEVTDHAADCPIMLDTDVPVIMVMTGAPILAGVDTQIVNDVTDCPINLFKYPELVAAVKARLGHHVGLESMRTNGGLVLSPMTREPILGGLVLGAHHEHAKATDWTLSRLFSGGKLLGNADLWFAVIWFIVTDMKLVPYLEEVIPNMTEHMKWRLLNRKTFASVSGLAQFVTTKIHLGSAIWYVLASGQLDLLADRDILRTHIMNSDKFMKLLDIVDYPLTNGMKKHIKRVSVMLHMLSWSKRKPLPQVSHENLKLYMRALYQNSLFVPVSTMPDDLKEKEKVYDFIPLDGDASAEQIAVVKGLLPKFYEGLTSEELVGLSNLVNPSLSASDIALKFDWVPSALPVAKIEWVYGLRDVNSRIKICPETMRPHYSVKDEDGSLTTWNVIATKIFGPVKNQMSCYRKYIDFVQKYDRFPDKWSYLVFCYNRYCVSTSAHTTMPRLVETFWADTKADFDEVLDGVTPSEFMKRANASCTIDDRVKIESGTVIDTTAIDTAVSSPIGVAAEAEA